MEEDIKNHKFLEYGEYNGHLYGTHLDSIRDVIKQVSINIFIFLLTTIVHYICKMYSDIKY